MDSNTRVTLAEKKMYFDKALKDAVELGVRPERPQMIRPTILPMLFQICDQYPKVDPKLVKKAKTTFDAYFDWLTS